MEAHRTLSLASCALLVACTSGPSGPVGGPVDGGVDTHCGTASQATSQASCSIAALPDAGPTDYGETLYNAEADDDDCKYHLKWTPTAIRENTDVTITAVATNKIDGKATTGAHINLEIFLNSTHPAPNTNVKTTESPPGTYQIGPVQFDAKGRWTVRFHLFETCTDVAADSPHGHVAFFADVP